MEGTEQILRYGGRVLRKDLFGFADLVALGQDGEMVFLQVTSWGHVPTRLKKINVESTGSGRWNVPMRDLARRLINGGHRVVIEGWRKNETVNRWQYREREVTLEDVS